MFGETHASWQRCNDRTYEDAACHGEGRKMCGYNHEAQGNIKTDAQGMTKLDHLLGA
jgi:hypothetical protein